MKCRRRWTGERLSTKSLSQGRIWKSENSKGRMSKIRLIYRNKRASMKMKSRKLRGKNIKMSYSFIGKINK